VVGRSSKRLWIRAVGESECSEKVERCLLCKEAKYQACESRVGKLWGRLRNFKRPVMSLIYGAGEASECAYACVYAQRAKRL
jgi:hypothetical protein